MANAKSIWGAREYTNKGNGRVFWMVTVDGRPLGDSRVYSNKADAAKAAAGRVAQFPDERSLCVTLEG